MQTVLKIEGLNKSFKKRHVLKGISLELNAGEVFGFLGPNGSGKTTTIKTVMGFLHSDSGNIYINGYDIKKDYENAMSCVGGIVENPEMYTTLSGRVNLEMYARIHDGITSERINEVVQMVGMQMRIDEKVQRYSLGMKQRLGLAQALLHKPRLLILDEPTNGLDPVGIKELRDILKNVAHNENTAVLVSSHQLAEMETMCDRVGIIIDGKIVDVKPISQLLDAVSYKSIYSFNTTSSLSASDIVTKMGYAAERSDDNVLQIETDKHSVPGIIAALVNANIGIYSVAKHESSLEDAFIKITKGENVIG